MFRVVAVFLTLLFHPLLTLHGMLRGLFQAAELLVACDNSLIASQQSGDCACSYLCRSHCNRFSVCLSATATF